MAQQGYGNFAFLYNINNNLYELLYEAESKARINYRACGKVLRDALENYIEGVINNHLLSGYFPDGTELYRKINALNSEAEMRAAGYLQSGETFEDRPLLPRMEAVTYLCEDGCERTGSYWDFMRRYSNSCSHPEIKPTNPKPCYANVLLCLRGYHLLMQRHFRSRLPKSVSGFNEDRMPIGDYVVYEAQVPADKERSKCVKEYWGHKLDEDGVPEEYVLIRTYDRNSTDETFMLRNQNCFTEAKQHSHTFVPEGMAGLKELTKLSSAASDQYIISYSFNRQPSPLENELLAGMTLEQRLGLCRKLVSYLNKLHTSSTPIYHRLLNYECVYVCDFNGEWYPYIVKFDHAKIVTEKQLGTVLMNAVESQNYLRKRGREKYLPPEWLAIVNDPSVADWAKVDIYALGVLLADILRGEVGGKKVEFDELEELGVSDLILDILENMLAESPKARASMETVQEFFEENG